jgi:hypothetical protein
MSFDAEDMKDYREAQQKRRADRLPIRQKEIEALAPEYEVRKLTDYQYRINGILDLYPIHQNWHNIKTNKRGNYKAVIEIVKKQINP